MTNAEWIRQFITGTDQTEGPGQFSDVMQCRDALRVYAKKHRSPIDERYLEKHGTNARRLRNRARRNGKDS